VLLCSGIVTLLVTMGFQMLKSSEPYQSALARAQGDERVQEALGTPIEARFFVTGSISAHDVSMSNGTSSSIEEVDLTIPIFGPKPSSSAVLRVVGKKTGAEWTYSVLEVVIPGQQKSVDLLKEP
jgi:hypothetical protein